MSSMYVLYYGPATFQCLMQQILAGTSSFCSIYMDDILIFSNSVDEHVEHLTQVFEQLRHEKCTLAKREVITTLGTWFLRGVSCQTQARLKL